MAKPLLFVLGDSISIQYGPYLRKMLAGRFRYRRKTGREKAIARAPEAMRSANGGDSGMVLDFLGGMVRDKAWRPDLLLLNCGLHDIKTDPHSGRKQVPLPQYRRNLRAVLDLLQSKRIPVAWVRTTPVNDEQHNSRSKEFYRYAADVAAYNRSADKLAQAAGAAVIDLHAFTRGLEGPLFRDHVHFTEAVQQAQAAFIAGFLAGMAKGSRV